MDARETLERRIDELCRENEQLREQVASLTDRSIRMADKMDCLNAENAKLRGARDVWQENDAKLRELVSVMRTCIDHGCMCEFCPLFASEEDMAERRCIADMKVRMRELDVL